MPLLKFVLVAKPSEVQLNNMKSNLVSSKDWELDLSALLAKYREPKYEQERLVKVLYFCRQLLTQSRKEAYEQGVLDTEAELRKKSQGDRDEELWSEGIKEGKRQAKYETRPSFSVGPSNSVAPSSSKTENKWVEKIISQTEIRVRGEVVEEVRKNVTHWWSEYMALRNQSLEGDAYETEDTGLSFSDLCAKRLSKLKQP
jgi:hypothetical protein